MELSELYQNRALATAPQHINEDLIGYYVQLLLVLSLPWIHTLKLHLFSTQGQRVL